MSENKTPLELKNKMVELWKQGLNFREIDAALGLAAGRSNYWVRKIQMRQDNELPKRSYTPRSTKEETGPTNVEKPENKKVHEKPKPQVQLAFDTRPDKDIEEMDPLVVEKMRVKFLKELLFERG